MGPVGPGSAVWEGVTPGNLADNSGNGRIAAQACRVFAAWSSTEWRVRLEADDALPWATMTIRDSEIWTEEVVEVFFDPSGDLESYFEVEINPLGTVTDLVLRRTASGWRKDFRWNVEGLASAAWTTGTGWAAELSIPFAALGAEMRPEIGQCWRANFLRIDRPGGAGTDAELSAWSPTGVRNFHRPQVFGVVEFCGG